MERRGAVRAALRAALLAGALLVGLTAGCSRGAAPDPSPTLAPGPAEAYLDAALGTTREGAVEASLRMEEAIATCMSKQGFDYVPDVSSYHYIDSADWDPPPGTRAFAEHYGYGYASVPDGAQDSTASGPGANQAIVDAMTPQEREAYERALWGGDPAEAAAEGVSDGASDEGSDDASTAEPALGGCFRAARDEVWGDRATDQVRADLEDEIARIDEEGAAEDPAVQEAAGEWSACMAEAGQPGLATPDDAEREAWDRWTALNDAIGADPTLGEVTENGDVAGQAELAAQEATVATADWDCRAQVGYDAAWRAARDRLQQEYVDAHRVELDAWVATFS